MRIFLIEDFDLKAERIRAYIRKQEPDSKVELFHSYQSGLRAIEQSPPDLIILDMTIPTFDPGIDSRHGRPRSLGGYELMRKMKRRGIARPVFIISQLEAYGEGESKVTFGEVKERCASEFSQIFKGAVFYSQNSDSWQVGLKKVLLEVKVEGQRN